MPRPDLLALVQRLVELSVRLVTERLEAAQRQLTDGARTASRRALYALVAALAFTLAAALLAAAAAEALAPLVASRALRLLLVSVPFVALGAWAAPRSRRPLGAAADDADDHRHQGQHQQHVNPRPDGVSAHHAEQPENDQEHARQPEHDATSRLAIGASDVPRR
jgi:hypothetical protein